MRPRFRSPAPALAALLLAAAVLLLAGGAAAFPFEVESWSVSNGTSTFSDDFEDGVLNAGQYLVPCGILGAGSESGGALSLANPGSGSICGAGAESLVVGALLPVPGEGRVEAEYRYGLPGIDEAYGIQLASLDGSDLIALVVARAAVGSGEVLAVTLFDETFAASGNPLDVLANATLSFFPSGFPADAIRLSLATVLQDGQLVPDARFAIDDGPWLDVLAGPGAGALDPANGFFGGTLLATRRVPEPAAAALLAAALAWAALRGTRGSRSA